MFFKNLLKANSTLHVSPLFYLTVRPCRSHKKSKRFLGISGHFFFIVNIFIKHFFFYLYSIQVHPKKWAVGMGLAKKPGKTIFIE